MKRRPCALDKYERARAESESELRYAGKFKSAEDLEKAYKELEKETRTERRNNLRYLKKRVILLQM